MDGGLKRWVRRRVGQRLLQQRCRTVDALKLGEQDARLDPPGTSPGLSQQSAAIVRARVHSPAA